MSKLRNLVVLSGMVLSIAAFADDAKPVDQAATVTSSAVTTTTETTTATKTDTVEKVNINTADADALGKVKGIGAKKAKEIVDYRTKNGNFKAVEDLKNVKGKGMNDKWFDKIKDKVTV